MRSKPSPRRALLSSGQWLDFQERELDEVTTVFSDIAQRESRYRKRWLQAALGDRRACSGADFAGYAVEENQGQCLLTRIPAARLARSAST